MEGTERSLMKFHIEMKLRTFMYGNLNSWGGGCQIHHWKTISDVKQGILLVDACIIIVDITPRHLSQYSNS